jgi:hypothetical protein
MASSHSRIARIARSVRRTWNELDYAQRRMFEIRTGVRIDPGRSQAKIAELERLYRSHPPRTHSRMRDLHQN